jgi:septal ring factor EnvC (AmiA/AmiB activator)
MEKWVTNSSWKWNRLFCYGKLNRKNREIFRKYSDKCQRICTVNEEIEAKSVKKTPQRIEIDEERKTRHTKNKMLKEKNQTTKQKLRHEEYKDLRTPV